ncbi:phage tail protein [Marinobacter sp.]|uniref:phage tail protein n=1 Tax=Marinobacter sp. TaxID=50741 RepID=UPI002B47CCC4|nr:tail fiber protein [Marinobacter sp.]HKK55327.1 tail fiber protein [Marinobacter sp.]
MKRIKLLILAVMVSFVQPAFATTDSFDPLLGEIKWVAFNFVPRGFAACDGQLLSIAQNSALFSLIGTIYGGDGRTTFALPDVRGRVMVHEGAAPGLGQKALGSRGGSEREVLTVAQMPLHSHGQQGSDTNADSSLPHDRSPGNTGRTRIYNNAAIDQTMDSASIGSAGSSSSHENMGPTTTLNCIIAINGIFPARS